MFIYSFGIQLFGAVSEMGLMFPVIFFPEEDHNNDLKRD